MPAHHPRSSVCLSCPECERPLGLHLAAGLMGGGCRPVVMVVGLLVALPLAGCAEKQTTQQDRPPAVRPANEQGGPQVPEPPRSTFAYPEEPPLGDIRLIEQWMANMPGQTIVVLGFSVDEPSHVDAPEQPTRAALQTTAEALTQWARWQDAYSQSGLQVIGLCLDPPERWRADVRPLLQRSGANFPVVVLQPMLPRAPARALQVRAEDTTDPLAQALLAARQPLADEPAAATQPVEPLTPRQQFHRVLPVWDERLPSAALITAERQRAGRVIPGDTLRDAERKIRSALGGLTTPMRLE